MSFALKYKMIGDILLAYDIDDLNNNIQYLKYQIFKFFFLYVENHTKSTHKL